MLATSFTIRERGREGGGREGGREGKGREGGREGGRERGRGEGGRREGGGREGKILASLIGNQNAFLTETEQRTAGISQSYPILAGFCERY